MQLEASLLGIASHCFKLSKVTDAGCDEERSEEDASDDEYCVQVFLLWVGGMYEHENR